MAFVSFLDKNEGLGELLKREPDRYKGFMDIGREVMMGPSELSIADREMVATYVSALNGCAFCAGTHASIAKAFGQDPALVEAMMQDPSKVPAAVPERLRPILDFARKLTQTPGRMAQSDADAVFKAGWSEQVLSDVVAVAAYFAMANRLADGHGIPGLPEELNGKVAAYVAEHGYPGPQDMRKPIGKEGADQTEREA